MRRVLRGVEGRAWAQDRFQSDGRVRLEAIQGRSTGVYRGAGPRRYKSKADQGAKRVVRQEADLRQEDGARAGKTVQEQAQIGARIL